MRHSGTVRPGILYGHGCLCRNEVSIDGDCWVESNMCMSTLMDSRWEYGFDVCVELDE